MGTVSPISSLASRPRLATPRRPDRYRTRGPAIAAVQRALGRDPLPWQRAALDVAAEVDARGRYVHQTVLWLIPRRGGKTVTTGALMQHRAMTTPRARVFYTAQTGTDASEWFREEHLPMLEDAGVFAGRWRKRMSQGAEQVRWLHNGGIVRVFAPTANALHGKDSDLVVPDEAWAHDATRGDELMQAIGPTQATRPGAQIVIISAAGGYASAFLIDQLTKARAAHAEGDPSYALLEYGVPDDEDATDPDVAARYHPAVGHTIDPAYLHTERARLGAEGFARAYGCRQVMGAPGSGRIDLAAWSDPGLIDPAPIPAGVPAAIAFDVSPDRDGAVLALTRDPDGQLRPDLIDARPGTAWIVPLLQKLARQRPAPVLGVNDAGPARDIADQAERVGLTLAGRLNGRDYGAACASIADAITERRVTHRGQPVLDDAIAAAGTRILGDAWAWSHRHAETGTSIAPLVALTVAAWTLDHAVKLKPIIASRG